MSIGYARWSDDQRKRRAALLFVFLALTSDTATLGHLMCFLSPWPSWDSIECTLVKHGDLLGKFTSLPPSLSFFLSFFFFLLNLKISYFASTFSEDTVYGEKDSVSLDYILEKEALKKSCRSDNRWTSILVHPSATSGTDNVFVGAVCSLQDSPYRIFKVSDCSPLSRLFLQCIQVNMWPFLVTIWNKVILRRQWRRTAGIVSSYSCFSCSFFLLSASAFWVCSHCTGSAAHSTNRVHLSCWMYDSSSIKDVQCFTDSTTLSVQ